MGRGEGIGTAPGRHVSVSKPVVLMALNRETEMYNLVCLHTSPFKMSACHTPRVHIGAAAPPHPSHIRRHALNTPHKQQHKCRTAHVGAFHMRGRGPVCCAWPSDCPHTTSAPRDTRQGTRNTRDQQGGVGGGCNALDYKTSDFGRKPHGSRSRCGKIRRPCRFLG